MRLRRKGRHWYLRVRRGGRDTEVATGCTDKKAAESFARRWERDAADPEGATRRRAEGTTVGELVEAEAERHDAEVAAGRLAPGTLDFYRRRLGTILRVFGADCRAIDLDAAAVDAFIATRRAEGVTDHTVHKELGALRRMLDAAARSGTWCGDTRKVIPARFSPSYTPRDRWLSVADVRDVVAVLSPGRGAWVALAAGAGAELAALNLAQRGDFDATRGVVLVRGTKNATRRREVPLVLAPCAELVARAFRDGDGKAPTLLRPWGKNWRDLQHAARRTGCLRTGCLTGPKRVHVCDREECAAAAVAPFSFHALRHSFATWHLAAGCSWDDVAKVCGHKGTAMLHRVYGHLGPEELRARLAAALTPTAPKVTPATPEGATGGLTGATSPDVPRYGAQTAHSARRARDPEMTKPLPGKGFQGAGGRNRTNDLGIMMPGDNRAEPLHRNAIGDTPAPSSPDLPRGAAAGARDRGAVEALRGEALALLAAVDEGRPAGDAARAFALAVLSTVPPGDPSWEAAVGVLEGGPLRVRRAVLLAGELLDGSAIEGAEDAPARLIGSGSLV